MGGEKMYNLILIEKTQDCVTSVPEHMHNMWELFYVRTGTGTFHNNGHTYPFSPGDIFITRPGELHYEISKDGYGNYFCFFQSFFLPPDKPFYWLHDAENTPLLKLMQLLYQASKSETGFHLRSTLFESFHQYVRTLLPDAQQNTYVEKLKQEIDDNFHNPNYTLALTNDDGPFCSDHIRRLFVKSVGLTPLQYLISLRIGNAQILISERRKNNMTLKEIAFASGYSDYYYFSRQFKKQTGFSPREWINLSPYDML